MGRANSGLGIGRRRPSGRLAAFDLIENIIVRRDRRSFCHKSLLSVTCPCAGLQVKLGGIVLISHPAVAKGSCRNGYYVITEGNLFQGFCTSERLITYLSGRNRHFCQRCTSVKRTGFNRGHTAADADRGQCRTSEERIFTDLGHAIAQRYIGKACAAIECAFANGAAPDIRICQRRTTIKSIFPNRGHTIANINGCKCCAFGKCIIAD